MNKLSNFILTVLKGMAIGIAMIIPGVSGGTLAIMMNVYDDIIEAISGVKKHFKQSVKTLFPIALGGLLGFVALYFPLTLGLKYIPIPTICLFVGLIIGGFPEIAKKIKSKKDVKPTNILILIACLLLAAGLGYGSVAMNLSYDFTTLSVWSLLFVFGAGILAACALVVPGVSGSMLLLVLGLYNPILNTIIPEILKFTNLVNNLAILGTLALGIVIGFFLISKLMAYLLKKHHVPTFYGIVGFILGSIIAIFYNNEIISSNYYDTLKDTWQIILAAVLLIGGIIGSLFVSKLGSKNAKPENIEDSSTTTVVEE